jgi:hypothetical protein
MLIGTHKLDVWDYDDYSQWFDLPASHEIASMKLLFYDRPAKTRQVVEVDEPPHFSTDDPKSRLEIDMQSLGHCLYGDEMSERLKRDLLKLGTVHLECEWVPS